MRFLFVILMLLIPASAAAETYQSEKFKLQVTSPDGLKRAPTANGVVFTSPEGYFLAISQVSDLQAEGQTRKLSESGKPAKKIKIAGLPAKRLESAPTEKAKALFKVVLVDLEGDQNLMVMAFGTEAQQKQHAKKFEKVVKSIRKTSKLTPGAGKGFGDFMALGQRLKLPGTKVKISVPSDFVVEKDKKRLTASAEGVVVEYSCVKGRVPEKQTFQHTLGKRTWTGHAGTQGRGSEARQVISLTMQEKKGCFLDLTSSGPPQDETHEVVRQILRSLR